MANSGEVGLQRKKAKQRMGGDRFAEYGMEKKWWIREPEQVPREIEREMDGMVNGMASRMDEISAIGNGQVPLCAATAWRILNA